MDFASVYEDLGGTYQRYKTGQAKFTAWLREAAEKVTSKPVEDPHGKLGYTLRLETMAQQVVDGGTEVPEGPINELRDVVLLRKGCAEFYRGAASRIKNVKLAKANAKHNHMIFVLEQMLAKLEAKVCRQPKPSAPTFNMEQARESPKSLAMDMKQAGESPKSLAMKPLGTMFENLQVFPVAHDMSDHSDGDEDTANCTWRTEAPSRPRRTKPRKAKKKQVQSPTDNTKRVLDDKDEYGQDEFDVYMVIYCLFEDFNKIRDHVVEKWCDFWYKDKHIEIETLAAITNAAYEIFQRMQQELERHPASSSPNTNFQSYTWIIGTLLASEMGEGESFVAIENGVYDPEERRRRLGPAVLKVQVCTDEAVPGKAQKKIKKCGFTEDQSMRLALRPWAVMHTFFGHGRPLDDIPCLCEHHRDFSDLYDILEPTDEELFHHDWFTAQDFSQDLSLLRLLKVNGRLDYLLPAEPELNLLFQDAFRRLGRVPTHDTIAFNFSLQLFVDIRRTLERDADSAFYKMQCTTRRVHTALLRHLKYINTPFRSPYNTDLIRLLNRRIHELNAYFLRDPIHPPEYKRQESPDRFHLLERDPVWAGLLTLRARMVAAKLGRQACETPLGRKMVDAGACVYMAARVAYPEMVPDWPAMEMWLEREGRYMRETDFAYYYEKKRMSCACGGGPWSRGADVLRGFRHDVRDKKWVKPEQERGAMEVMWERYGETFRFAGKHLGYLEEMVELSGWGEEDGKEGRDSKDSSAASSSSSASSSGSSDTSNNHTRPSPIEMLKVLEKSVGRGFDHELYLDYFELFDGSVRMLRELTKTNMGTKLGIDLLWKDGDDLEYLEDILCPLIWSLKTPKIERQVVKGIVAAVRRVRDAMNGEGKHCHDDSHPHDNSDPFLYKEEFPGKLPPKTRVVVRKTGNWAMGWGDSDWKVVNEVGPQLGSVVVDDELRDKFWSTHELSEKFDRSMEPRKM